MRQDGFPPLATDGVPMRFLALLKYGLLAFACAGLLACEPTVKVEAPKEPITINLNIKVDAEVRVKLEEAAKEDIEDNPGVF
jgi:hypothetical protein